MTILVKAQCRELHGVWTMDHGVSLRLILWRKEEGEEKKSGHKGLIHLLKALTVLTTPSSLKPLFPDFCHPLAFLLPPQNS